MMRLPNRYNLWIKAVLALLLVWWCIGLAPIQVRGRLVSEAMAASALDGVIEGAKKEGKVVIYESQSLAAWSKIMGAFQKRYPFVKEWNQEQLTAADVPARIVNESRAGAPTADLFGNSPPTSIPLIQRGLVVEVAWKTLGVPEKTIYDRYTVLGNMFAYVIGYNTQMISSRDVPKTWEGLLDPKWKGKGGWWRAASPWNALAAEWGISKTEEYLKKFMANDFRPSRTTADVATWVAAGEVPLAVTVLHRLQQAQEKGAPVAWVFAEPVPILPLAYGVIKGAKNANTAKLLIHWLTTQEGANVYEKQTHRGNPFVEGTEFAKLMGRLKTADFPADKHEEYVKATKAIEDLLKREGR